MDWRPTGCSFSHGKRTNVLAFTTMLFLFFLIAISTISEDTQAETSGSISNAVVQYTDATIDSCRGEFHTLLSL